MGLATELTWLWDRQREWSCRLQMVRAAKRFLYVSTYYVEPDTYGRAFLDAVTEAARCGVRVTLWVDSFGQRLGAVLLSKEQRAELRKLLDDFTDAGGVVGFYRPDGWCQRVLGGGQHVKIQVSEAGELLFGSSNITKSSFEDWNELSVLVRGPAVREIFASLRGIGCPVAPEDLNATETATNCDDLGAYDLDYWFCNPNLAQGMLGALGWRGHNQVTDRMLAMVESARHSLRLTSFYFKPHPLLERAILAAARRGVEVEIFHSHLQALPATELAWIGGAVRFARYLEAGVTIRENRRGEHSKVLLVDDAWGALGSYNLEHAAHDRLAEAMIATRDPRVIKMMTALFDNLRSDPNNEEAQKTLLSLTPRLRFKMAVLGPWRRWL